MYHLKSEDVYYGNPFTVSSMKRYGNYMMFTGVMVDPPSWINGPGPITRPEDQIQFKVWASPQLRVLESLPLPKYPVCFVDIIVQGDWGALCPVLTIPEKARDLLRYIDHIPVSPNIFHVSHYRLGEKDIVLLD